MTPETAKMALEFLTRITLRPQEIQALVRVEKELRDIIDPAPEPTRAKSLDSAFDDTGEGVDYS